MKKLGLLIFVVYLMAGFVSVKAQRQNTGLLGNCPYDGNVISVIYISNIGSVVAIHPDPGGYIERIRTTPFAYDINPTTRSAGGDLPNDVHVLAVIIIGIDADRNNVLETDTKTETIRRRDETGASDYAINTLLMASQSEPDKLYYVGYVNSSDIHCSAHEVMLTSHFNT